MSRVFLIGHRGVGKSTFLEGFAEALDLDLIVDKITPIQSFFNEGREQDFRNLELKVASDLKDFNLCALGAGFPLDKFNFKPEDKVIWLQRKSDQEGRIFFDRPALNPALDPLDDFLERFKERERCYASHADFKIELEEGSSKQAKELVKKILEGKKLEGFQGFFTLEKKEMLKIYKGPLELRTDLLTEDDILKILAERPLEKNLVAIRSSVSKEFKENLFKAKVLVDFPLEEKEKLKAEQNGFISSHEKLSDKEITSVLDKGFHLKWAPELRSFEELKETYKRIKDKKISFLPREIKGRWSWFRQIHYFKNPINFFRYGRNAHLDQPLYYELEGLKDLNKKHSGAVLGENVELSQSPAFHRGYFKENFASTYVKIPLERKEWSRQNLDFLKKQRLAFFSVTAPFKKQAGEEISKAPLNTLSYLEKIEGLNTDSYAIKKLVESLKPYKNIAIWGAGAMGQELYSHIKQKAQLFSARESAGKNIEGAFDALVWAAGSSSDLIPHFKTLPAHVFDLEYKDSSVAKSFAKKGSLNYFSGKDFFDIQAREQQKFWKKRLDGVR